MKALHIARKDLYRFFRSPFVLAFMLVLPLLQTGIPYLAFGGLEGGLNVEKTRVSVVNLDQPVEQAPGFLAGDLLLAALRDERLSQVLTITEMTAESKARAAVDGQQADVAVIIPASFTGSLFDDTEAPLVLYQDPAATLGPAIVQEIIASFADGFSGSRLAVDVASAQATARGEAFSEAEKMALMKQYGAWVQSLEARLAGPHAVIQRQSPSNDTDPATSLVGPLMIGLMVFFAYFVGAITAQSLIHEDEQGTLARLFRTATPRTTILTGKFLAVLGALTVQIILLIAIGGWLFGIAWGDPLPVALGGLGLVITAAGFGVMLMSFLKSTRQAFLVMGGAVMLTGMAGGTMTTTFANLPPALETISLFTPQGWAMRALETAMRGGTIIEVSGSAAACLAIALLCLAISALKLRKRFG